MLGVVMKKRNQLIQDILGVSVTKIYHRLEKTWREIDKKIELIGLISLWAIVDRVPALPGIGKSGDG